MKPFRPFFALALATIAKAEITLNEIDADQTGTDSAEFIELFDGGAGNTPLDSYVVVLFNGSGDKSYLAFDLAGKKTNAQGFFVIGNPAVPNVDLVVEPGSGGAIQNGADAAALYKAKAEAFPNGSTAVPEGLVDALVYGTNDPDDAELLQALTPGEAQANDPVDTSMARLPDGGAPFKSSIFQNRPPTPGSANQAQANLALAFTTSSAAENAGKNALIGTISRTGPTAQSVSVKILLDDPSELTGPATLDIPVGASSIQLPLDAVDDSWADGTQKIKVSLEASGYNPAEASVEITDDADNPGLVVNEVYADDRADANQDGEGEGDGAGRDEFVEFVNVTAAAIDLSDHTLTDSVALRHTFPAGTRIDPGCALVIFGGGDIVEGRSETFGGALVQKANGISDFGLGLNNTGDSIRVLTPAGFEIAGNRFGAVDGSKGSLTRIPDLTGDFAPHAEVVVEDDPPLFSPGFRTDGKVLCQVAEKLLLRFEPASVSENAGATAAKLVIERSGSTEKTVTISLTNSDPSEIALPASVEIAAGEKALTIDVAAVDDNGQDGSQNVIVTAVATGFLDGQATIEVKDDNDPPVTLLINELDADQAGDETGEFIELYDGGVGIQPLDGFLVVLFNGASSQSYLTVDLRGQQTNKQGFFVFGDATVPNVDLVLANFTLQNGPDAVALYHAAADAFPNNTAVTVEGLVDAVTYGTSDEPVAGLIDPLTPAETQVDEGSPDNVTSIGRFPDGGAARKTATFLAQVPSPGAANAATPTASYEVWAKKFTDLGQPADDPDGDRVANLFEYVWKLNPLKADSADWQTRVGLHDGKVALEHRSPKEPSPGVKISYEKSGDLKTWVSVIDKEAAFEISPNEDGTENIRVLIPVAAGTSHFARLRAGQ